MYCWKVFFEFHFVLFVFSRENVESALFNMADEFYFQLDLFELSIILIFLVVGLIISYIFIV